MYAKIEITGMIESLTGMHIGGSSEFAAIGAVDSPVVRDVFSDLPMIPGSSLKGKMRTLLAKQYNESPLAAAKPDDDVMRVRRLFGYANARTESVKERTRPARLLFSDMVMCNEEELKNSGVPATEVKYENTINRLSAVANPRQIERSVRGARFPMKLIYNVDAEEEMEEDFETIATGFRLLEYDYIGGSGSRGYGKIKISDLDLQCVVGECDEAILNHCGELLKGKR